MPGVDDDEFLAIVKTDFADHGLPIEADEIFLSDCSKTDGGAILDILACGAGNRIGITDPVYPVYVDSNVMAGNTVGTRLGDGNSADSTEIVTNQVSGNLICQGNSPPAQIGDSGGSPNDVGGNKIGECTAV